MGHTPYARYIYLCFDGETDKNAAWRLSVLIDAVDFLWVRLCVWSVISSPSPAWD